MAILSLILSIIGGAIVGGAMILADKIGFYLIVLIPILGGSIIGFFVALPYLNRKNTAVQTINPTLASNLGGSLADVGTIRDNRPAALGLIVIAILGTLIASAVYWGGAYLVTLYEVYQGERTDLIDSGMTAEETDALMDEFMLEETGSSGFVGYVRLLQEDLPPQRYIEIMAEEGISINRATSSSSGGITLQGGILYAYWVLEIVLMAGFAISTALRRARAEPEAPPVVTAS